MLDNRQPTQEQDYYDQQYQGGDGRYSHDPTQPISRPSAKNPEDKARKLNYAQDLQDQIRMKQDQKYRELRNEREKEMNALKARLDNDPFGKQGSGAPLRDRYGNIITTKSKALHVMHDYPNNNKMANEPVFSLKARLARENLVSQSLDSLPRQGGFDEPNPMQLQMQMQQMQQMPQMPGMGQMPFQMPFTYPFSPYQYPSPYPYPPGGMPPGYPPGPGMVQDTSMSDYQSAPRAERALDGYGGPRGGGGSVSFALPLGGADRNDREAKQKRMHTYQDYQNDLLRQMEEKKRKKEAEEARKKMEDDMEEERVRRENAQMREQDQDEAHKRKKHFENFQQENEKLMNIQNSGVLVMDPKKNKGKRVRTPIEELQRATMMTQSEAVTELNGIENLSERVFPNEAGRRIQATVENQLSSVKREWDNQQMELHNQLLEMKRQLLDANRERVHAQQEIGELKTNIRSQHVAEEIRRTELYNALLKGQALLTQPAVLPTITRFEHERDADPRPFEFPKGRSMYKRDDDGDALDAMLAGQSKIIDPNARVGHHGRLVERVNSRPASSGVDDSEFGVNYLNYFNQSDDRAGIRLDDKYGLDLPDGLELSKKTDLYYEDGRDPVGDILRKNKERLDVLEDIEYKEFGGDKDIFAKQFAKRPPGAIDDEIYQMLKSDSVEDDLLDQINNPRRYHADDY